MSPFVPFNAFLEQTAAARPDEFQPAVAPGIVAPIQGEFDSMKDHILSRYKDVQVSNSFVDADGQHFDCIKIDQQPGLLNSDRKMQATPPRFVAAPGGGPPAPGAAARAKLAEDRKDPFGNTMFCPPGFVPVLRLTLDRMTRAGTFNGFFEKAPGGGVHPGFGRGSSRPNTAIGGPAPPSQSVGGAVHAYAHASQFTTQSVQFLGGRSWLNLWNPNPAPGVFSLSQQWYAGDNGSGLQTVEGGWHVYPSFYSGSTATRLFIYWTADGYSSTGSYNLDRRPGQGGFIQVDNTWMLGGSFETSASGGEQKGVLMQWQRDPGTGNWWLYLQDADDPVAVGYFPRDLYGGGQLSLFAQSVDFGGEVCSQVGQNLTGPMGSGSAAAGGWQTAAFHKEIGYLTTGGMSAALLSPDQRDAPSYTIDLHNESATGWTTYFYFGGQGGQFG